MQGYADIVKILLGYSADPDAENEKGYTPLLVACKCQQVRVTTLSLSTCQEGTAGSAPSLITMSHHYDSSVLLVVPRFPPLYGRRSIYASALSRVGGKATLSDNAC